MHSWVSKSKFKFNVALRPQRPLGPLGMRSPGRPPQSTFTQLLTSEWVSLRFLGYIIVRFATQCDADVNHGDNQTTTSGQFIACTDPSPFPLHPMDMGSRSVFHCHFFFFFFFVPGLLTAPDHMDRAGEDGGGG